MAVFLMTLAGTGLLGCFGATLALDMSGRGRRMSRQMQRPRSSTIARERA